EPAYAKDIAQLVKAELAEIGVDMKIETLEFTQWVDRWLKADFDMAPGLNGGGPDPDFYVYRYFTDDGNLNFVTSYKNPVSSDAIKQARASSPYLAQRQLGAIPTLIAVPLLTYLFIRLIPGDAIAARLGTSTALSPEQLASLRAYFGLDQPLLVQYWTWLSSLLRGDAGY